MSLFEKICKVFYNNKTLIQGVKMIKNKVVLGSLLAFSLLGAKDINIQDNQDKIQANTDSKEINIPNPIEVEKKTKTGILVGVELGLGGGSGKGQTKENQIIPDEDVVFGTGYYDISPFNFNAKIFGGYQKYFGENETFGFNVKGSLGFGFLHNSFADYKVIYDDGSIDPGSGKTSFISNYIPLSIGIEANFLYDFFQKAEHTVGLNVGLGYSFVYGANVSMSMPNKTKIENFPTFSEVYKSSFKDKNIYYSLISPKIGIHYYYGRHQVEFNFSFDKAFGETKNVNQFDYGSFGEETFTIKTKPNYFYTFNLSYAYRF